MSGYRIDTCSEILNSKYVEFENEKNNTCCDFGNSGIACLRR